MKLYITKGSPYARIARVVVLEKGLADQVEIISAKTRQADSPYYGVNPSGRVPHLVRDDGVGLEDSALICAYLDSLDGEPKFGFPAGEQGWEVRRLEALARSTLDGFAVLGREKFRSQDDQSPTVLQHEAERARRLLDLWEREIEHPLMRGALNLPQITLACALGFTALIPEFQWRPGRPRLGDWFDQVSAIPSLADTTPPVRR